MTFDQYLKSAEITAADFGAKCEPAISEASICRIRKGQQNITSDTMLSIIKASGGKVTAAALLSTRPEAA